MSSDERAPEPVLLAKSFDAQFLLDLEEGGVANEEFQSLFCVVTVDLLLGSAHCLFLSIFLFPDCVTCFLLRPLFVMSNAEPTNSADLLEVDEDLSLNQTMLKSPGPVPKRQVQNEIMMVY